jgi:hypothetical protein
MQSITLLGAKDMLFTGIFIATFEGKKFQLCFLLGRQAGIWFF